MSQLQSAALRRRKALASRTSSSTAAAGAAAVGAAAAGAAAAGAAAAGAAAAGAAALRAELLVLSLSLLLAPGAGLEADSLPGWLGETHRSHRHEDMSLPEPRVTKLSWRPRAFLYKDFLSQEECDHIINVAKPRLERSEVVQPDGNYSVDEYRSSWGAFLDVGQDPVVSRIEERIARWTFLPIENQEAMQVLHYGVGQKYEEHTDYFEENDRENQRGGHRIATVLMYLSDVEHGGETVFTQSEPDSVKKDRSWSDCGKRGVAVKPKKGNALLFYSLHPNATTDEASMHAGCPVLRGEKWSATKWIHVRPFDTSPEALREGPCVDEDSGCAAWASIGECEKNPGFMLSNCRKSCKNCKDDRR